MRKPGAGPPCGAFAVRRFHLQRRIVIGENRADLEFAVFFVKYVHRVGKNQGWRGTAAQRGSGRELYASGLPEGDDAIEMAGKITQAVIAAGHDDLLATGIPFDTGAVIQHFVTARGNQQVTRRC